MKWLARLLPRREPRKPTPAERSPYGAKCDKTVVEIAMDRTDEILSAHPEKRESLLKLVAGEMVLRRLGASTMKPKELRALFTYIKGNQNHGATSADGKRP